jgi:hypothetical protein
MWMALAGLVLDKNKQNKQNAANRAAAFENENSMRTDTAAQKRQSRMDQQNAIGQGKRPDMSALISGVFGGNKQQGWGKYGV